jgi:hypothetical protein
MSDIVTVPGSKIDIKALTRQSKGKTRSALHWPNKQPTQSEFQLWKNALQMICPSKSRVVTGSKFISAPHRIWRWAWDEEDSTLHKLRHDSLTGDVFASGRKPNRFHYSHTQKCKEHNTVCSVESTLEGEHFRLTSVAPIAIPNPAQTTFMEVLNSWGNT